jgi:hypothetical protein
MTEEYMEETEDMGLEYDSNPVDTDKFVIDDDGKANWAIQKIKEAQAEVLNWREYYDRAMEKIEKRQNARIEYLRYMLRQYFQTVPHHETKTQASYDLPSGKLICKTPGPKFETDDATLVGWLKENNMTDFIKTETKEKPMWGELKKTVTVNGETVVTEDGEIVPGVTVVPQEPTFEIK